MTEKSCSAEREFWQGISSLAGVLIDKLFKFEEMEEKTLDLVGGTDEIEAVKKLFGTLRMNESEENATRVIRMINNTLLASAPKEKMTRKSGKPKLSKLQKEFIKARFTKDNMALPVDQIAKKAYEASGIKIPGSKKLAFRIKRTIKSILSKFLKDENLVLSLIGSEPMKTLIESDLKSTKDRSRAERLNDMLLGKVSIEHSLMNQL